MDSAENLTDLYLLTLVVEAGGFSAASRQVGLTKSKLSRRIINLEHRLGTQLLYRNARHFAVTAVGERVYRHAVLMRESAQAAEIAACEARGKFGGHVRISAHGLLMPLLEQMLVPFTHQHPYTRLALTLDSDHTGGLLLRQQADITLGLDRPSADSSDLVTHTFGTAQQTTVASPALFRRLGSPSDPEQVPGHLLLNYISGAAKERRMQYDPDAIHATSRLTSNHASTLLAAARVGLGFVKLPLYLCDDDLREGRLIEVFEPHQTPLLALTRREPAMPQAALGFLRFMPQHLNAIRLPGIVVAA